MFHSGGNQFSNILRHKDDANILRSLSFIQRLVDFVRGGSHSPTNTREGESQHRFRMTDDQNFHRFLPKQDQEGNEQTIDGNAFCQAYEDQRTT